MRLYSILKNSLKLTKKELNEYVKNHRITVNGDEVPFTSTIEDIDIVEIDGKRIQAIPFYYYLYYKPRGVLSTISKDPRSYIHQINLPHKVSPAGRLDKDSEGLMILSNDGKFLNEITGDSSILDKVKTKALEQALLNQKEGIEENVPICMKYFDEVMNSYRNSVSKESLKYFEQFRNGDI